MKMEEHNELNATLNGECISTSDVGFCSFYYKALKHLLDIDKISNSSYLLRYFKILNEYYDNFCLMKLDIEDGSHDIINQLKSSLYYRIVYLYRNATLFSSAVAFHFQNVYEQNPNIIKKIIKKRLVKICSIGGCSIPDIVAVITVLKSIAEKDGLELDFRVTIIDFSEEWKNTCIAVLRCLDEFHEDTWKINFIQCNLAKTNSWTPITLKAIQEADVITMVKYASKFDNKWNIVKKICNELKTGAILFTLDNPTTKLIQLYLRITELDDLHLIDAEICDYHTLDIKAVKHLRTLYSKHFGNEKDLRSNIAFNLFVSVWIKTSSEADKRHEYNMECIFKAKAEKYNPKQSFVSHGKWEHMFNKRRDAAGWNQKRTKKFLQEEKEKKNSILSKLIHMKKEMDSLQNEFFLQIQWLENEDEEFSETIGKLLDDYLIQKRQYTSLKKHAYTTSLTNNLCSVNE